ncbi:MAG: alanine:cation symporter family protein [Emergencia sp.]|jgi:AGCS family alanine or glycine:cation symporter|uniref:Alanine:cation symporter family protein n=1 Tax=Anaerotruncus colihominis TaxID=169435 RepID=A0A845QS08_9FIRM|nr:MULTISPECIES: sodium:alanine symporter family protein [Clostridia]MCI9477004.1 alanine:cation symporter family protein [Emergencia sp.]MCI9638997.1 alanine:cation symporter family protein [Emergencia sp.]NBH62788.1 alanine:cation symporter family protein [Anaerotruncus colihominis]NCF00565.1 alanine:cation symporter family protein [Emergencia sp. 1XD21-10]NCF03442.1 alanine:cation symporter family protein [Anaerotruncus sp. 80]
MNFTELIKSIDDFVWGIPLIVLIMGTGILLTCRVKLLQVRKLGKALKFMVSNKEGGEGEVTSFGAFCTAMAATIGTGNIVGVATAVVAGGPGALFWMIVAAFFGMATKYSEGVLAIKYRTIDAEGHALGGPFYYIEKGMGTSWKWLAKLFAIFGIGAGLLGIGTITQVNGIASAVKNFADPNSQHTMTLFGAEYSIAVVATAIIVAVATALVVIGGIQRISSVTTIIVPFMAITYVVVCVAIILYNIKAFPAAIVTIVQSAFGLKAVAGGALGAMMVAVQNGVARGIFSNEAGLGSAPIAAAAAQTKTSVRQGLISMTGTFIDTIIICTMTGTTLIITGATELGLEGAECTAYAFGKGLPWSQSTGAFILMMCLAFFAFTTILGWDYYSERCLEYLAGKKKGILMTYKWLYIFAVLIGPFLTVEAVWTIADIFNGLMAIPNLIALVALSGVVARETKDFFEKEAHLKLGA